MGSLLKLSKITLLISVMILIQSCATPEYVEIGHHPTGIEILVTPNRIVARCEYISDENPLYGFSFDILDDRKTVTSFFDGAPYEYKLCTADLEALMKIKSNARRYVYISGWGQRDRDNENPAQFYTFPGLGSFPWNGIVMHILAIKNDAGDCYYGGKFYSSSKCPKAGKDFLNSERDVPSGY